MPYEATIIVSVYDNIDALRTVLYALQNQTIDRFEIVISEDGESTAIRDFIDSVKPKFNNLIHTSQKDLGFRKNAALNRAIIAATTDYLVFIDGDCVPHKRFMESHLKNAEPGTVCSGRRAELGPMLSHHLTTHPNFYHTINNPFFYSLISFPALLDHAKNFEAGVYSNLIHRFHKHKKPNILGCNFSCYKNDLIKINGFNEEYTSPGIGEDTDLSWRLHQIGIDVKNIKFLAPIFHLHHEHKFKASAVNKSLLEETIRNRTVVCEIGLNQYTNKKIVKQRASFKYPKHQSAENFY